MSYSIPYQFEELELSGSAESAESCGCPECRTNRLGQEVEDDEFWNELNFEEDEFADEVPLLQKAGPIVAAKAAQVAAAAKSWTGLTPEKTCWVQNVLNKAAGETLKTDGIFGPLTRGAVLRFQSIQSLQVDGIVGRQTETALIQAALNEIARQSLVLTNGVMDARTQQEIRRFQSQRGLTADGIVGPITRGAMIDALGGQRCIFRPSPKPQPPKRDRDRPPLVIPHDPGCDKPELSRRVNACIEGSKRCLIDAHKELGLALLKCKGNAFCNVGANAKYLLGLKRCRDALLKCDAEAKAASRCR